MPLLLEGAGVYFCLAWMAGSSRYAWAWAPPLPASWMSITTHAQQARDICAAAITGNIFSWFQAALLLLVIFLGLRLGCRALGRLGGRASPLYSKCTAKVTEVAQVVAPCMGMLSTCYGIVGASVDGQINKEDAVLIIFPASGLGVLILMLATMVNACCEEDGS
ncbi:MAG: hypothetical protein ACOCXA_00290 [Planctomycetota bacterium]